MSLFFVFESIELLDRFVSEKYWCLANIEAIAITTNATKRDEASVEIIVD